MSDRDDFDRIVEGLHLDLSFPDEPADPVEPDPAHPSRRAVERDTNAESAEATKMSAAPAITGRSRKRCATAASTSTAGWSPLR
jgi:hypothetical protein